MPAYMKLGDIKGEAADSGHKDWITIHAFSNSIHRAIPPGAKDQQRARGDTTLGDIDVVRELDKSSTKLQEACANGTLFPEVEIHLCTTTDGKQEPVLKYKLSDVIISSYSFHADASGSPLPTEQVGLSFSEVEWTYVVLDPKTLQKKGEIPAKYNPSEGKS